MQILIDPTAKVLVVEHAGQKSLWPYRVWGKLNEQRTTCDACDCGKHRKKQVCFFVHLTHFIPFLMSSRCLFVNDFVGDSDFLLFALIALYMLFSS